MRLVRWLFAAVLTVAVMATAFLYLNPEFGGEPSTNSLARMRTLDYYAEGEFRNTLDPSTMEEGEIWAQIDGQFFGDEQRHPPSLLPIERISAGDFAFIDPEQPRAAWLGHSSVYIELAGKRILTDPVFSDVASPTDLVGPERFHPLPFDLGELPPIDLVVISHDHYDHLDMETVKRLADGGTVFVVPLGVSGHLQRWGIPDEQIVELAWGGDFKLDGVTVTCTEARHYSGRALTDRRSTLWSAWVLSGRNHRVYFSGDTGYSDHFRRTGEQFGPFDLTLIKIGAYGPGAAWTDVHMSAEDAVRAHRDLRGDVLLPTHWSTFNLGFHAWDEPIERALAKADRVGVRLATPKLGQFIEIGSADIPEQKWWREIRSQSQ